MNPQAANSYLRTRVLTASPEQLQLMLFDGAIRFGEQARAALAEHNLEQTYQNISRVRKIVTELASTLRPDVDPDVCAKLSALYAYVFRKLLEAGTEHRIESMDEALSLLRYQRETWAMLLEKLGQEKGSAAARIAPTPASTNPGQPRPLRLSA